MMPTRLATQARSSNPPRPDPVTEPHTIGWLVQHPAGVPAEYRILVPEHQQLRIPGLIPAGHQNGKA
jgi:hypothetical protein